MKIIKRNGSEAIFDREKIVSAITRANESTREEGRMDKTQIDAIAREVEEVLLSMNRAASVEEIQELVETGIMSEGAYEVAKS